MKINASQRLHIMHQYAVLLAYDATWSDRAEKKIEQKHQGEPKPQALKDEAIFTLAPGALAQRLKGLHGEDFKSAMGSLSFYKNRAGKDLSTQDRDRIDKAKTELRKLYGKDENEEGQRKSPNPRPEPAGKHAPSVGKPSAPIGSKPTGKVV